MNKLFLLTSFVLITACSNSPQQSTVPMDMQAVVDYQQRVITKQTVNSNDNNDEPLNQSDKRPKNTTSTARPVIYPSIGIGYHHGWGSNHYWY